MTGALTVDTIALSFFAWNTDIVVASLYSSTEAAAAAASAWNATGVTWCSPYLVALAADGTAQEVRASMGLGKSSKCTW
jgi:hypothetical protein